MNLNADCDLRTARLIASEVRRSFQESHGSQVEIEIACIKHSEDMVHVRGVLFEHPGDEGKPFVMQMPRVDGPLDYFM